MPRDAGYAMGDVIRETHVTAEDLLAQHAPAPPFPWSVALVAFSCGVLVTLAVRTMIRWKRRAASSVPKT